MGLKSDAFPFLKQGDDTFLIKKTQKPFFEKKLHFDLLDHQLDTLNFILSQKF